MPWGKKVCISFVLKVGSAESVLLTFLICTDTKNSSIQVETKESLFCPFLLLLLYLNPFLLTLFYVFLHYIDLMILTSCLAEIQSLLCIGVCVCVCACAWDRKRGGVFLQRHAFECVYVSFAYVCVRVCCMTVHVYFFVYVCAHPWLWQREDRESVPC